MIAMLDTSHDPEECSRELGCKVEQLLTPLDRIRRHDPLRHFAIDNGAYSLFDPEAFRKLLSKESHRIELCRFVAVPDVVGSARRTLEVFHQWHHELINWNLAYVCQDGQEDLPIPWAEIDAIFIGGSTHWKMSKSATQCIKAAQALEKWVHVGRVNTAGRFEYFQDLGVNSIDGTGLSRYSWMRREIYELANAPDLPM